jgi:pseudouridine kinase
MSDVVVIGGANLDVRARVAAASVAGTSNPGCVTFAAGGVARNIAETLASLDCSTALLSIIGSDTSGDMLLQATGAAGVDIAGVHRRSDVATGAYCAILDADGELNVAVADMAAMEVLDPALLAGHSAALDHARLIVADCNLPQPSLAWLMRYGPKLIVEPVSVAKSARLSASLHPARPVLAITPNRDEARALTGQVDPAAAARMLHERGARHVMINCGSDGAIAADEKGALWQVPSLGAAAIAGDVTGAGDASVAGLAAALLQGLDFVAAVRHAQAAAGLRLRAMGLSSQALAEQAARIREQRL